MSQELIEYAMKRLEELKLPEDHEMPTLNRSEKAKILLLLMKKNEIVSLLLNTIMDDSLLTETLRELTEGSQQDPVVNDMELLKDFSKGVSVVDDTKKSPFKLAQPFRTIRGGQGEVAKVQIVGDTSGKLYARKKIAIHKKSTSDVAREYKTIAEADHPHIIKFEYVYIHEGHLNVIMSPWCENSLHDVKTNIYKDKLNYDFSKTLEFIINTVACLTSAIFYLHNIMKVKHLDIKPKNIVLDNTSLLPYVIDFGISERFSKVSAKIAEYAGTPRYCSPEQEDGQPCRRSSDIYSLGGVFIFLLLSSNQKYSFGRLMKACKKGFWDPKVKVALENVLGDVPGNQDLVKLALSLVSQTANNRPTAFTFFEQLVQFAGTYKIKLHCIQPNVAEIPKESEVECESLAEGEEEGDSDEEKYSFLNAALPKVSFEEH